MQTFDLSELEGQVIKALDIEADDAIEWDSLQTIEVMALLVDRFNLRPDPEIMMRTRNLAELRQYVAQLAQGTRVS